MRRNNEIMTTKVNYLSHTKFIQKISNTVPAVHMFLKLVKIESNYSDAHGNHSISKFHRTIRICSESERKKGKKKKCFVSGYILQHWARKKEMQKSIEPKRTNRIQQQMVETRKSVCFEYVFNTANNNGKWLTNLWDRSLS